MNMEIQRRGIIYDATQSSDAEKIAYTTSLVVLDSGVLLAGWQMGTEKHTPHNTIGLARSTDGGQSWQRIPHRFEHVLNGVPGSFLAAEMVEAVTGRLQIYSTWVNRTDPTLPLFNPETEGLLPTKIVVCESTDDGDSWSAWREIDTGELKGCAVTGPILKWSDGSIGCSFESFKEFDDPSPVEPGAWIVVSRDAGNSFASPTLIAQDPTHGKYFWDQRLATKSEPGAYVGMFWTHNRAEQCDMNVHIIHGSTEQVTNANTIPTETVIEGQICACAADGNRVLAVVVDREQPGTIALWISKDNGASWGIEDRMVLHQHDEQALLTQGRTDIDYVEYWDDMAKWSFGHPAIQKINDGWLVAWYAGLPDRMSIHFAILSE